MARKFFLFILLVVVWAALYLLLTGGESAAFSYPFFSLAHPSKAAMPRPWAKQATHVQLSTRDNLATRQAALSETQNSTGLCGNEYEVQTGDTLGVIAQRCGIKLADLQALNPNLVNPNRIYPGQQLVISPEKMAATHYDSLVSPGIRPGAILEVTVEGLPPLADAQVGIGLSSTGYRALVSVKTNVDGILMTEVTIPHNATSGDHAFIMVTVRKPPATQIVSDSFKILP